MKFKMSFIFEIIKCVHEVTQFKIDQNKKSKPFNRLSPRQDSGHSNFSYGRYAEKRLPQIYRDLYGHAMLVPT